ncbi:calponin homology domain-containing protein DDB_G0272472-like [Saccostrea cucullata]|uniref:calponin homology domain-containing protein DDB_G0272472-like n=1 Tax=Saccostrea cuccullata TaxID=36930 RepID=UPI002ED0F898
MGDNRRIAQVRTARSVICRVLLLDGKLFEIDVDKRAVGQILFDKVCEHLDLVEKDYFGLSFTGLHTGLREWLNVEKKISKQMKGLAWEFKFEVKFYPPDPQTLHEDLTRYQLCLQIRNDIVNEKLPCSAVTYALLGSYTVQSELGDFDIDEFGPGTEYIRKMRFAPHQDRELLKKIAELHKTHRGQTPEEAELHFLENAKKLAMYGVDLSNAKDGEGVDIQLGVCWSGILVFREKLQINKFVWPKILKMSYRRKKFYIKLRTGEFEEFQSLIGFKFLSSKHSKRMWKICVENHAFFRNREPDSPGTQRGFLKLGSKFRYSGRTHFQTKQAMLGVDRPSPFFDRVHSKRATYHGRTKNKDLADEMYKPRPEPRHIPEYNREEKMMRKVPEPEINDKEDREDVFEDEEEEEEEPDNRKSRMEKMHAVPTPLAQVMMKKEQVENNNQENNRRRRSFEEEMSDRPLDDSMVRTDRLNNHNLVYRHASTNSGKYLDTNQNHTNVSLSPVLSLTKTTMKRQRGRQRTGSESFKKVSFDEESLRSASSQFSRSDSELFPQKLSLPPKTRYQKKRTGSQSSVESPLAIRSTMTASPSVESPLEFRSTVTASPMDKDLNSSIDEGYSDTFERKISERSYGKNTSYTNSSKSDSFDGSRHINETKETNRAHRNKSHLIDTTLGGSLYRYSSSDSEDFSSPVKVEEEKVTSKSKDVRQVGRRGRQKEQPVMNKEPVPVRRESSDFVIKNLESEPGGGFRRRESGPGNLSKNYRIAPSEKSIERRDFSKQDGSNVTDTYNYINNEAILLEKYIIRKPESESSSSPREQNLLDDSILVSNLRGTPEEVALQGSIEYCGFAAGPRSTSSVDDILDKGEQNDEQHTSHINHQISKEEISELEPSKAVLAEDEIENDERHETNGRNMNDALTNSTASILSLSSEEGSVTVNDFIQSYDHEPCVRRARSMTLGQEEREPVDTPSFENKKVRFCSEDNLVYEVRYGFSDEEKPPESPEKLNLNFIDDSLSDDQLSDSESSPNTPSLSRYFNDSSGSSSSCTPDTSPRLETTSAVAGTSHRTLLQKSLQKPANRKIMTDGGTLENDERAEEMELLKKNDLFEDANVMKEFSNESIEMEEDFNSKNQTIPQSLLNNELMTSEQQLFSLSENDMENVKISEMESKTDFDEEQKIHHDELDAFTPLQSGKKSDIKAAGNICRNLFKDDGKLKEVSNASDATAADLLSSKEIPQNSLDETIQQKNIEFKMQSLSMNSDEDIRGKNFKVKHPKEDFEVREGVVSGHEELLPVMSSLSACGQIPAVDEHFNSVTYPAPLPSSTFVVSSTSDKHTYTVSKEAPCGTTSIVPSQSQSGISDQSNYLHVCNTTKDIPFESVASPVISTNDQSETAHKNSSAQNSSIKEPDSTAKETCRNTAFIAFQSTPVDKPFAVTNTSVSDNTQSRAISTQGKTIITTSTSELGAPISTTSHTPHKSEVSASFIKPSSVPTAFSQSAFSDWNRTPTPIRPLVFIPPKKTMMSALQKSSEDVSTVQQQNPPKKSKSGPDSQMERLDGQQKSPRDSYSSTAEWVLSHSNRFVNTSSDKVDKGPNVNQVTAKKPKTKEDEGVDFSITRQLKDRGDISTGIKMEREVKVKESEQMKSSSPIGGNNTKKSIWNQLEREGGGKENANDWEVKQTQFESLTDADSKNINLKAIDRKENTVCVNREHFQKSGLHGDKQFKSIQLNVDGSTISPSRNSSECQELKKEIEVSGRMNVKGIPNSSNEPFLGNPRENYEDYRDFKRPLNTYTSESMFSPISARQKKKVYIDGSLQRRRVLETQKEKGEAGKDAVDNVIAGQDEDGGLKDDGVKTESKDSNMEREILAQRVEAIENIEEYELAEEVVKDSQRGSVADLEEMSCQRSHNNLADSNGERNGHRNRKKEGLGGGNCPSQLHNMGSQERPGKDGEDLERRDELPLLCDSENSELEEDFKMAEEEPDSLPENSAVMMRVKPQVKKDEGPPLPQAGGVDVPTMLPRRLSAKRLSSMMVRPESPEAVYILSEERSVDVPPNEQEPPSVHNLPSPPLDPPALLSKEERKKREKEEKERKKREKEEQKRKKKEEEKEKKRLAKEKKKKPPVEEKWQEAVAVSATTETVVVSDRAPRRMSSFEEQKEDKPEHREADEREVKSAEAEGDSESDRADQGSEQEGSEKEDDPKDEKATKESYENKAFSAKDENLNRSTDRVGEEFDL